MHRNYRKIKPNQRWGCHSTGNVAKAQKYMRWHWWPQSLCASGKFYVCKLQNIFEITLRSRDAPNCQKLSGHSGRILHTIWKNFWTSFQTVWKISGQSGRLSDNLQNFQTIWDCSHSLLNFVAQENVNLTAKLARPEVEARRGEAPLNF